MQTHTEKHPFQISTNRTSSGHRAGCDSCSGGEVVWHGPDASAKACRHAKQTGHTTWVEYIMSAIHVPIHDNFFKKKD